MPPLKPVSSLEALSCSKLANCLVHACTRLETLALGWGESDEKDLEAALDQLPASLLERATHQALELLTSQAGTRGTGPGWAFSRVRGGTAASFPGLPTALRLLPRSHTSRLDLGSLFSGARLSRNLNTSCRASLATSLARTVRLSRLELRSKCTDDLLLIVSQHFPLLVELNISLSELVTDTGLASLLSCPNIASLDLLKCWCITPGGVKDLLLALKKLRKLYFANMKSVLEQLMEKNEPGPFMLEHFDSSEYSLILPGEKDVDPSNDGLLLTLPESVDSNPACWLTEKIRLTDISKPFPWISTIKLLLSDQEVGQLTCIPHLVHLEIEFSDDPAAGLLTLLNTHSNRKKFVHFFLHVGPIQASHLLALADNCTNLVFFRLIGFQVESASSLRPYNHSFHHLKHLNISLYDDEDDESSDEEEENDMISRHTSDIVDFFLTAAPKIEVINIHMNSEAFLVFSYLSGLLEKNPLLLTTHLHLSSPKTVKLGEEAVRMVVDQLPQLQSLKISTWDIDYEVFIKKLREEAVHNNLEIIYL